MKKIFPQFENVTRWQCLSLVILSVISTWIVTIYAVSQYALKTGSDLSKMGGLPKVALTTFDVTVIVFGLGVFLAAGIACLIILSVYKPFRASPKVQYLWCGFIFLGVCLAYVFR